MDVAISGSSMIVWSALVDNWAEESCDPFVVDAYSCSGLLESPFFCAQIFLRYESKQTGSPLRNVAQNPLL